MSPPSAFPACLRRLALPGWVLFALVPVALTAATVVPAMRNIAFWDELDTALELMLRLDAGAGWREVLERLFAINNEHRMVTSRLLFATSYWLTGTVNFAVIGAIGNLFLVGLCVLLVVAQRGAVRRVWMTVVLAFLMFQLGHFENFIWSGASIDHFQVVLLAVGALAALARGTGGGVALGAALATAATFTLTHGVAAWAVGALLLTHQRRWRHLAAWAGCTVAVAALFLIGFTFNPGHGIAGNPIAALGRLLRYWLALLGGPVALGNAHWAPWPGAALLVGLGFAIARGAARRHPLELGAALFAVAALALIAYGRAELAGPEINSRYLVLGALAWAMLGFMLVARFTHPRRPFRVLAAVAPALVLLALGAHRHFAPLAETFVEVRDRAATEFAHAGEDASGISRLHPRDRHADIILRRAAERGVWRLPPVSQRVEFTHAQPGPNIVRHVDELRVGDRSVTAGGWAMRPGKVSRRGEVFVVLRSPQTVLFFSTITLPRPDVATAHRTPDWRLSGFRAVIPRDRLPAEDFEVGVLIRDGARAEFAMTNERLRLAPAPAAD